MNPPSDFDMQLLQIYLADHQAGARGAVHRLGQMRSYTDLPIIGVIEQLNDEVRSEYRWVADLARRLDLSAGATKQAAARLGELLGRLKLNGRLSSRSPLSPLLELEVLSSVVVGKLRLWQTLGDLAGDLGLDQAELSKLQTRAERQLDDLASAHAQLRRNAFLASR